MGENRPVWNIPEKKAVPLFHKPMRVKYVDIFDMKEFFDLLHEWLMERKWESYDGDKEQWETYYGQRHDQSGARELWILWKCRKKPSAWEMKVALTYYLNFYWHVVKLVDTEVVREGYKWKVNKGSMELKCYPVIEETFKYKLEQIPLINHFEELIAKRVYHHEIEKRKKELYHEVIEMFNWIKQWFKMKRYLPYEETPLFFPSRAWPSHLEHNK